MALFRETLSEVHVPAFVPTVQKIAADDAEAKRLAEEQSNEEDHDSKVQVVVDRWGVAVALLPLPLSLLVYYCYCWLNRCREACFFSSDVASLPVD